MNGRKALTVALPPSLLREESAHDERDNDHSDS